MPLQFLTHGGYAGLQIGALLIPCENGDRPAIAHCPGQLRHDTLAARRVVGAVVGEPCCARRRVEADDDAMPRPTAWSIAGVTVLASVHVTAMPSTRAQVVLDCLRLLLCIFISRSRLDVDVDVVLFGRALWPPRMRRVGGLKDRIGKALGDHADAPPRVPSQPACIALPATTVFTLASAGQREADNGQYRTSFSRSESYLIISACN